MICLNHCCHHVKNTCETNKDDLFLLMVSGVSFHGPCICGPEVKWKVMVVEVCEPGGCLSHGARQQKEGKSKGLGSR